VIFEQGQSARAIRVEPRRFITLYAIARPIYSAATTTQLPPRSHLRLSLRYNQYPESVLIATSNEGEYADGRHPIRTEIVDLSPSLTQPSLGTGGIHEPTWGGRRQLRECWLVVERMHVHPTTDTTGLEEFSVEISTDSLDGVACGQWVDWQEG
jgi:hypothetical protein